KNLRSFKYAVEFSSFKKAAKKLAYSQSTISKHITELEQSLEADLFIDGHIQNGLTKIGELTYNFACQTLLDYAHFKDNVSSLIKTQTTIKIGGLERYLADIMIDNIVHYQNNHPHVTFDLIHGTSDETLERLRLGQLDIGIVADRIVPAGFASITLKRESLVSIISLNTYEKIKQRPNLIYKLPILIDRKASIIFEYVLKETNEFLNIIHVEGDSIVLAGVKKEQCLGIVSDGCFDENDFKILKTYNDSAPIRLIYPEKWSESQKQFFFKFLIQAIQKK
ncbi:TPA: LysR family transcriptional regulator, partial [Enterococcus faecalis]|nr:LysR family transcriptional regulator [Enterococcus faecalis]